MNRLVEHTRYAVAVVSLSLFVLAASVLAWGVARTGRFAWRLVAGDGWTTSKPIAEALQVVDLFLVATTVLVVAAGLWELFVADIDLPVWLHVGSLRDLETKVAELVVVVVAVKFVERFVTGGDRLDLLYEAGAVALVGAVLLALGHVGRR